MNKQWLCYYELHVDDRTFYVHKVIDAPDGSAALRKLESEHGDNFHLQAKGCLGELTLELVRKYLSGERQ